MGESEFAYLPIGPGDDRRSICLARIPPVFMRMEDLQINREISLAGPMFPLGGEQEGYSPCVWGEIRAICAYIESSFRKYDARPKSVTWRVVHWYRMVADSKTAGGPFGPGTS